MNRASVVLLLMACLTVLAEGRYAKVNLNLGLTVADEAPRPLSEAMVRLCGEQTDIALQQHDLSHPSEPVQCFTHCLYEQMGLLHDGVFVERDLIGLLAPHEPRPVPDSPSDRLSEEPKPELLLSQKLLLKLELELELAAPYQNRPERGGTEHQPAAAPGQSSMNWTGKLLPPDARDSNSNSRSNSRSKSKSSFDSDSDSGALVRVLLLVSAAVPWSLLLPCLHGPR
ncbi:GL19908 [Drosophila persimilis]|uniref:GL19908 n=1 Tax=Drosophila persimilis TaxID=7234 RepID=B4H6C8_DROPE|nr:GL19908 [Drosophila persimilis]